MKSKSRFTFRRDKHQDSDRAEGMGDNIEDFSEQGSVQLTGSSKSVKFIRKDETNFNACKKMKFPGGDYW